MLNKIKAAVSRQIALKENMRYQKIYTKYKEFTMIPEGIYIKNLKLAEELKNQTGDVVECGVWRGGMIAGISEILGKEHHYYLYDSFEGLPAAKEIDGKTALEWQNNKEGAYYHDNCKAEIDFSNKAMSLAGVDYTCVKGWFDETVPTNTHSKISLLRLDGDWYESTLTCLKHLYPRVVKNGLILIDDYYTWDGCSRAVHDYLSSIQSVSRIYTGLGEVAFIRKNDD
jgi:O-methyltransferase